MKMAVHANPWVVRSAAACTLAAFSLAALVLFRTAAPPNLSARISVLPSSSSSSSAACRDWRAVPPTVTGALLHYATTAVTPQQNRGEIGLCAGVLARRGPCNFLVFGLGHDSVLWNALNYGGRTVFLEEDSAWIERVLKDHPYLRAFHVSYPTNLTQAEALLRSYPSDPSCRPARGLPGSPCGLALSSLPAEIYATEWDVIMIDAPRGYFDAAPGRMTAIFSAAVMAGQRKDPGGLTHVFLHDVDRRVERLYAGEFLCGENLLEASGRLWHFGIKPFSSSPEGHAGTFCNKSNSKFPM